LSRRIGERVTVMIDGPAPGRRRAGAPAAWAARTAGSAWEVDGGLVVEGEGLTPGTRVPVRVVGASAYDLLARVDAPARPEMIILETSPLLRGSP
jgi:TRAM domain-containing protein